MPSPKAAARRAPASTPAAAAAPGETRQRLVQAALHLLQVEGFPALTQARVAQAAGLRQSHLTYYFRTRNDLLKAVSEQGASAMLAMLEGSGARPTLAAVRELLASVHSDASMPRLMVALTVAADEDPELKRWLREFDRGIHQRLLQVLQPLGVTPSAEALDLFQATLVGAAVLSLQDGSAARCQTSAEVVRRAFDRLVADGRTPPAAGAPPRRRRSAVCKP